MKYLFYYYMLKSTNWPSEYAQFVEKANKCHDAPCQNDCDHSHYTVKPSNYCQNCGVNKSSKFCVELKCKSCCVDNLFCPRHHLRKPLRAVNKQTGKHSKNTSSFSTKLKLLPPFLYLPNIERGSIDWRMGNGESYLTEFCNEFNKLSKIEKRWYAQDFPEPKIWTGFYMQIDEYHSS